MEELFSYFQTFPLPPSPFSAGEPPAGSLTMDSSIQGHSLSGVAVLVWVFSLFYRRNLGDTNARILVFFKVFGTLVSLPDLY